MMGCVQWRVEKGKHTRLKSCCLRLGEFQVSASNLSVFKDCQLNGSDENLTSGEN
jgi:hypothetical protein